MTEKEYNVKLAEVDVVAEARLELEKGYERLKIDVEEAANKLNKEILWRQWKQAEAEQPFESN